MITNVKNFLLETWIFFNIGIKQQKTLILITSLFSMVIPLGVIIMVCMMPVEIDNETAIIYISGNMVTSISNLCITTLAQILIGIRSRHGFEHMATLPISKWSPLIGYLSSSAVSTLPALIVMPIIGQIVFGVKVNINAIVILLIVLGVVIMAGIGAIIGTCSDNYQVSETISMIMMFFVMFATPVYYSIEKLPVIIQLFQRTLPFTYILEAIRYVMLYGLANEMVNRNIVILFIYLLIVLFFTNEFFNWSQKR